MIRLEKPTFKDGKAMVVAGLRQRYDGNTVGDIPELWQRMGHYFNSLPEQVGRSAYGMVINLNHSSQFDYVAGIEVTSTANLPPELVRVVLPAQHYAVFPHPEHVTRLKDTMTAIWREWMPASGFPCDAPRQRRREMIEHYGPSFDPKAGMGDVEVWVPVRKPS